MADQNTKHTEEIKEVAETAAVAAAEASWPQTRAILRVIFVVLAVAALMWALYALEGVILLVVLSIFFAYLIAPLVELVRKTFKPKNSEREVPRVLAVGVVYLVIFASLGIATYLLLPGLGKQISDFTRSAPGYLTDARARAGSLNRFYDRIQLPPGLRTTANNAVNGAFEAIENYGKGEGVQDFLAIVAYIPWLVLIPILAFFLLKDADSFRQSALMMLPRGRLRWRGDEFFQDINNTLAAYIRAQLIACALIGVICTVAFMVIGLNYSLVLGIIAGLLEFIPLAGPLTVAVLAGLITSFQSGGQVVAVLTFLLVLRIVHDYVIYPRIIGQGIHLHPLAVVLAILCGEEIAGLAGIFLAIPAVAIITVTYRHWLEHRGSTGLVADFLKPAEQAVTAPPTTGDTAPAPVPVQNAPATATPARTDA